MQTKSMIPATETYYKVFDNNTIIYDNVTWITPSAFRIVYVANATILSPSGLVFNKSKPFNFNKYCWKKEEHKITKVKHHKKYDSRVYTLV